MTTEHHLLRGRVGISRAVAKASIRLMDATRRARENTVIQGQGEEPTVAVIDFAASSLADYFAARDRLIAAGLRHGYELDTRDDYDTDEENES